MQTGAILYVFYLISFSYATSIKAETDVIYTFDPSNNGGEIADEFFSDEYDDSLEEANRHAVMVMWIVLSIVLVLVLIGVAACILCCCNPLQPKKKRNFEERERLINPRTNPNSITPDTKVITSDCYVWRGMA